MMTSETTKVSAATVGDEVWTTSEQFLSYITETVGIVHAEFSKGGPFETKFAFEMFLDRELDRSCSNWVQPQLTITFASINCILSLSERGFRV